MSLITSVSVMIWLVRSRGKIVACQFVIQACQRHLDDLMAEKSKSFRYRFDKDLAERAAKFIQLLPHTKGEWAFKRMPITLEPWQLFVICCAFGWVNKGSRLRRFREVYTEIPRKNGKSAISAGVALYCFACDNEFGAEVYSGATTEKQAWEVFRPARLMCKRTPMLTEAFGIEVNASNMNRPEDGARFEPLIGNPGDGSSPHCAVVDEYHEHATDALYTTMLTGMGARRQPLMWAITTAGYNIEGPCYDKRREVIEMLNGSVCGNTVYGYKAPHKTGAGIGVLVNRMATYDAPSVFFYVVGLTHPFFGRWCIIQRLCQSMVAQAGASSEAPVSIRAGYANPVWATTSEIGVSGGSVTCYRMEAATCWLLPLPKNRNLSGLSPQFAAIARQLPPKFIILLSSLNAMLAVLWCAITSAFLLVVSAWRWLMIKTYDVHMDPRTTSRAY